MLIFNEFVTSNFDCNVEHVKRLSTTCVFIRCHVGHYDGNNEIDIATKCYSTQRNYSANPTIYNTRFHALVQHPPYSYRTWWGMCKQGRPVHIAMTIGYSGSTGRLLIDMLILLSHNFIIIFQRQNYYVTLINCQTYIKIHIVSWWLHNFITFPLLYATLYLHKLNLLLKMKTCLTW